MTMPNDTVSHPSSPSIAPDPSILPERTAADQGEQGGGTRAQIRDVKDQVMDQARQSFRHARDSAGASLNDTRQHAAQRIGGLANAVRGTSERLRSEQQDRVADLTDGLADQVERLGTYLRDRNFSDFRRDAESFARRQPVVAVGIALGLGLLGARFLKSGQAGRPQ
jgi:ElaB/YqjD/DUF883 family membrane-anchored ribosome-binding protein